MSKKKPPTDDRPDQFKRKLKINHIFLLLHVTHALSQVRKAIFKKGNILSSFKVLKQFYAVFCGLLFRKFDRGFYVKNDSSTFMNNDFIMIGR